MDAVGAHEKVLEVATSLGLRITVSVAHEVPCIEPGKGLGSPTEKSYHVMTGVRTWCTFPCLHTVVFDIYCQAKCLVSSDNSEGE